MKCADCKFWRVGDGVQPFEGGGECHRRAPQPTSVSAAFVLGLMREGGLQARPHEDGVGGGFGGWDDRRAAWPATYSDDFCGEFAPRQDRQSFV